MRYNIVKIYFKRKNIKKLKFIIKQILLNLLLSYIVLFQDNKSILYLTPARRIRIIDLILFVLFLYCIKLQ